MRGAQCQGAEAAVGPWEHAGGSHGDADAAEGHAGAGQYMAAQSVVMQSGLEPTAYVLAAVAEPHVRVRMTVGKNAATVDSGSIY